MKWTDTYEIVDELIENHSDIDPKKILFTDLRYLVFNIKGFEDDFESKTFVVFFCFVIMRFYIL